MDPRVCANAHRNTLARSCGKNCTARLVVGFRNPRSISLSVTCKLGPSKTKGLSSRNLTQSTSSEAVCIRLMISSSTANGQSTCVSTQKLIEITHSKGPPPKVQKKRVLYQIIPSNSRRLGTESIPAQKVGMQPNEPPVIA